MKATLAASGPPRTGVPPQPRRLVAVFAHPDDETFGPGGTFARYAAEGVDMTLVCGTRGEAGSIGHSRSYGPALLGRIRQAELAAAAEVLGFSRLVFLGYPDGGVANVEMERGTADVLAILREIEPAVVVAFHPSGISGHPDHKRMTAFAAAAVDRLWAAGREGGEGGDNDGSAAQRPLLHYYTLPASVTRHVHYRELPLVPDEDVAIEIDTEPYAEVKRRAIFCHKTQLPFYERLTSLPGADGRFAIERYVTHRAPRTVRRGTDLFAPGGAGAA